jgi:hypothetical protein
MIMSRNSFIFYTIFRINNDFYKHPEEKIQRSQIWRMRGKKNAPLPF